MYHTTFDNERKQWNGQMTKSDFNPDASLGNVILNALLVNGSRVAQVNYTKNRDRMEYYPVKILIFIFQLDMRQHKQSNDIR